MWERDDNGELVSKRTLRDQLDNARSDFVHYLKSLGMLPKAAHAIDDQTVDIFKYGPSDDPRPIPEYLLDWILRVPDAEEQSKRIRYIHREAKYFGQWPDNGPKFS